MNNNSGSFDRLVAGLSSEERVALLRKLEPTLESDKESLSIDSGENRGPLMDLEKAFQKETVFVRLWIFLKGLFSNTGIEGAYNDYRIGLTVKKIVADSPNLIDPRYLALENCFYEKLLKLQEAADFFKDGIAAYERDEDGFCFFLTLCPFFVAVSLNPGKRNDLFHQCRPIGNISICKGSLHCKQNAARSFGGDLYVCG